MCVGIVGFNRSPRASKPGGEELEHVKYANWREKKIYF